MRFFAQKHSIYSIQPIKVCSSSHTYLQSTDRQYRMEYFENCLLANVWFMLYRLHRQKSRMGIISNTIPPSEHPQFTQRHTWALIIGGGGKENVLFFGVVLIHTILFYFKHRYCSNCSNLFPIAIIEFIKLHANIKVLL